MAQQEEQTLTGFELDLRPQNQVSLTIRLGSELREALAAAKLAGKPCSLRVDPDSRGQVGPASSRA